MATKKKTRNIVIEWPEVKSAYIAAVENRVTIGNQPINNKIRKWHDDPLYDDGWEGTSAAKQKQYVTSGYFAKTFSHSADYAALSSKQHFTYNEEDGELDLDRVFDGHDSIFLNREQRESRPGLRLMVEFSFSWATSAECISQYGAWVASLVKTLESSGYDLVLDVWINLDHLFVGDRYTDHTNIFLRVKQENEQSNFTEWSALFAPAGYRHLGFLAKCLAGEKIGKTVTDSFGSTMGGKDWGVSYDRENQLVTINVNQRAGEDLLPIDKLNKTAIEEGLIREPIKVTGLNGD